MPSSTSSSDSHLHEPPRPIPTGPWGRTWLVAIVLGAFLAGGFELVIRGRGYHPSVKDDEYAWAWQRARVADDSPHTVAILGTSRIHVAFSPTAFTEALPGWTFVQLAIDGSQPAGSLIDLAGDPDFRGVAIVETIESGLAPENWGRQDADLNAYHRRYRAPGAMIERWLATAIQWHLAILSDGGVHAYSTGWTAPRYVTTWPDRTQFADYSLVDLASRRNKLVDRIGYRQPPTQQQADAWLAGALQLEPFIAQIQARGGTVAYVRMPTCDERWAADQKREPRALYWNRLAAATHAVTIHFDDYASLRNFECPDTSHIASKDGPRFTRALIEALAAHRVFPAASVPASVPAGAINH